jgi:hypothetical protein
MAAKIIEQVDVAFSEEGLLLIYGTMAPATRYPKDIKEKRLLNKTLLKIDTTVIFVKTMKRGRAFVTTSTCESIELEVGALNSISADEYVIDITANLINQPADDITSNANTQEGPKKL